MNKDSLPLFSVARAEQNVKWGRGAKRAGSWGRGVGVKVGGFYYGLLSRCYRRYYYYYYWGRPIP